MPRFLNQHQVPMRIRRPHLDRYRRMLRESLHNPGLASEQRDYIKDQLAQVGLPKVYGHRHSSSASTPGNVAAPIPVVVDAPTPTPTVELPEEAALNLLVKAEILAQAESEGIEGVSIRQTKAEMIETLLRGRAK